MTMKQSEAETLEELLGGEAGVLDCIEDVLLWQPTKGLAKLYDDMDVGPLAGRERHSFGLARTHNVAAIEAINTYVRYCQRLGRFDLAMALVNKAQEFAS